MTREDILFLLGFVVAILAFLFFMAGIATGPDEELWTKMTDREDCYFHETRVNNMWLTPGKDSSETSVYCLAKD